MSEGRCCLCDNDQQLTKSGSIWQEESIRKMMLDAEVKECWNKPEQGRVSNYCSCSYVYAKTS